jgi:hypothetical protein
MPTGRQPGFRNRRAGRLAAPSRPRRLRNEIPRDEILVHQVGVLWSITEHDRTKHMHTLDEAVARAVQMFKERPTAHVVIRH